MHKLLILIQIKQLIICLYKAVSTTCVAMNASKTMLENKI